MEIRLEIVGQPIRYEPEVEIQLYRVIPECMNNVMKHSLASETQITMYFEQSQLRIQIVDDGVGFEPYQQLRDNDAGFLSREKRRRKPFLLYREPCV